jgi:U4/U6 small nuclear ribonucleoprotein PRP3
LRLDALGREVDEQGKVILVQLPITLKVNQHPGPQPTLPPPPRLVEENPFFDPELGGTRKIERRRKAGFEFVQEGKFQKEAEAFR